MKRLVLMVLIITLLLGTIVSAYAQYRSRWFPRMSEVVILKDVLTRISERQKVMATRELDYLEDPLTTHTHSRVLTDTGLQYVAHTVLIPEIQADIDDTQRDLDRLATIGN